MPHFKNLNFFNKKSILIGITVSLIAGVTLLWMGTPTALVLIGVIGEFFIAYGGSVLLFASNQSVKQIIESHQGHEPVSCELARLDPQLRFKQIVEEFSGTRIINLCPWVPEPHSDPLNRLLPTLFDPLSASQKCLFLSYVDKHKDPYNSFKNFSTFERLLQLGDKGRQILKHLFKGLASRERIHVIIRMCDLSNLSLAWATSPTLIKDLFENVTLEDKLEFLATRKGEKSILMHFILDSIFMFLGEELFIRFLFTGLSSNQLRPILMDRYTITSIWHVYPQMNRNNWLIESHLKGRSVTALDVVMRGHEAKLANLLIEYGAIEADLKCDFYALAQCPRLDVTPYRNKIKAILNETQHFPSDIENLVINCLTGEPHAKASKPVKYLPTIK